MEWLGWGRGRLFMAFANCACPARNQTKSCSMKKSPAECRLVDQLSSPPPSPRTLSEMYGRMEPGRLHEMLAKQEDKTAQQVCKLVTLEWTPKLLIMAHAQGNQSNQRFEHSHLCVCVFGALLGRFLISEGHSPPIFLFRSKV